MPNIQGTNCCRGKIIHDPTVDQKKVQNWLSVLYLLLALLVLAFVFCFTVYRAAVQAIAHDEALTYVWFLDGGVSKVLGFNANNHVLFTLLAKPFVKFFGITELSLRAPALLGCALYLLAVFLLARKLFGDTLLLPITVAVLTLNPTVMDFLAAGRGYGLGIGFLSLSIYFLACASDNNTIKFGTATWRWQCGVAAALLGLSAAANLSNVIPAFGLGVGVLGINLLRPIQAFRPLGYILRVFAKYFVIPGVLVSLFILWPFLIQARPGDFYVGYGRLGDSARDIFNASFLYKWTNDTYGSLGSVSPASNSWQQLTSNLGTFVILPGLVLFLLGSLVFLYRTTRVPLTGLKALTLLFGGSSISCIVVVFLLHYAAHAVYPLSRTALYAIPLFSISVILAITTVLNQCSHPMRPILKLIELLVVLVLLFDYGSSLNKSYFRYNAYDVFSRQLFLTIANDARAHGLTNVRIGGTWWYEPEINFYRRRFRADWMKPYDVQDRSYFWHSPGALEPADYNYYVFIPANDPGLGGPQVRTIFQDATTHLKVIAIAQQSNP